MRNYFWGRLCVFKLLIWCFSSNKQLYYNCDQC
jgi:hypothetical protein